MLRKGTKCRGREPQANGFSALFGAYPFGSLTLDKVNYSADIKARLLAHDAPIAVENDNGKAKLVFPQINPDEMKCGWLYAFELDRVK